MDKRAMVKKLEKLLERSGRCDGLVLNWRIRRLQKFKAAEWEKFSRRVARITETDPRHRYDEESSLHSDYSAISDQYDDEIQQITSIYFLKQAERLLIPKPPFSTKGPDWMESQITGLYRLAPDALHELRSRVRIEWKERREVSFMWLAAVTGIIGTLTGLVSVLRSG